MDGILYQFEERTNGEVMRDICKMFIPARSMIYDITYGRGKFWEWDHSAYTVQGFDKNPENQGCKTCEWSKIPELGMPKCDVLVFDPPMVERPQKTNTSCIITNFKDGIKPNELLRSVKDILVNLTREWLIVKMVDSAYAGKQNWYHFDVYNILIDEFDLEDLIIRENKSVPISPHMKNQIHFRKNISYFFVFRKKGMKKPLVCLNKTTNGKQTILTHEIPLVKSVE